MAKFAAFLGKKYKSHTVNRYDGIAKGEYENLQGFDGPILVSLGESNGRIDVVRNRVGRNSVVCAHNRIDDCRFTPFWAEISAKYMFDEFMKIVEEA